MGSVLNIFADFMCPWCYFSTRVIERLYEQDVAIQWVDIPVNAGIPGTGRYLEETFSVLGIDIQVILGHLETKAKAVGLPFRLPHMVYNTSRAQELSKWADHWGHGLIFRKNVFHAYFAEGKNIYNTSVLKELAAKSMLPCDDVQRVIKDGRYRDAVKNDWRRSRYLDIATTPAFAVKNTVLVGSQSFGKLMRLVKPELSQPQAVS